MSYLNKCVELTSLYTCKKVTGLVIREMSAPNYLELCLSDDYWYLVLQGSEVRTIRVIQ